MQSEPPLGLEGTLSDGLISAVRMIDGTEYIQVSAPISPGSSGGPIVDEAGRVLGIATLSFRDGQNLNLAVPSRYIRPLWQLAGAPRLFAASVVPLRQSFGKSEAVSAPARFIPVLSPTGVYRLEIPEDDQFQHWIRGRMLLVADGARYFATGWYRSEKHGDFSEFSSPTTITRDGRVAMRIESIDVEGGFVDDSTIALTQAGTNINESGRLLFLTNVGAEITISAPEGIYLVEGRGWYPSGDSDPIAWRGTVSVLSTDMQHRNGRGNLVQLNFILNNSKGGSRRFSTTAAMAPDRTIYADPFSWTDDTSPSTDHIDLYIVAGQINVRIDKEYKKRDDHFLNNRIELRGAKIGS